MKLIETVAHIILVYRHMDERIKNQAIESGELFDFVNDKFIEI